MKFAVAKDLITPDVKTGVGGYSSLYGKEFRGIHDDLFVKALLLDDGKCAVLLITFDLLFHDYTLTETIAEYVEGHYGIPGDHVIISHTHSHAGPCLEGYDPGQASDRYEAFLLERTKSCIDRTFVNTFEGSISFGAIEGDWNINRRRMIDGKMRLAPNPEGAKDNRLNILKVADTEGRSRALLLNYACHPVTLHDTLWISAEYPGRICQLLESRLFGSTAMFFQGAGANARPRVTADGDAGWKSCTFDELDDMSTVMANNIERALRSGGLKPIELGLAARRFIVQLETEVYPKAYFEAILSDESRHQPARNEAKVVLDNYDVTDNVVDLHAGIVRLSDDVYIAFLCGEVCFEVKEHIRKVFGDRDLIFIGYGDATAYIVDDKLLAEGGYESEESVVEYCLKGKFKPGIDKKMQDAFRENLEGLERQEPR